MREEYLKLDDMPALLLGERAERVFLFVHGQGGNKEEARAFAELACPRGWQVLGVDLPEHGERAGGDATFDPWHAVPELRRALEYASSRWGGVALRANSIGSYFSLLAFSGQPLEGCLLVSPLLDMERMIENMMRSGGVTKQRLEREQVIELGPGQTLSWEYLSYARSNPISSWSVPTMILRAEGDQLIDEDTVTGFARRFGCRLTVTEGGEHWFHTPEQLDTLRRWEEESLERLG